MHCANIYGVRLILREFNCCAHGSRCRWHLLKTSSHSLPLSLPVCCLAVSFPLYLLLRFFLSCLPPFSFSLPRPDGEMLHSKPLSLRFTTLQVMWSGLPSPPSLFLFSLSLSIQKCSLFPSVLSPPWQRQTKAFHFSLALLALSVFVLYQTRLPLALCSLLLFPKKVSRGPRAPALRQGACLSRKEGGGGGGGWEGSAWWAREGGKSKSEYIISFSALELGWDLGGKPRGSVCDKGATSRNLGTIHASRRFHPTRGVC